MAAGVRFLHDQGGGRVRLVSDWLPRWEASSEETLTGRHGEYAERLAVDEPWPIDVPMSRITPRHYNAEATGG